MVNPEPTPHIFNTQQPPVNCNLLQNLQTIDSNCFSQQPFYSKHRSCQINQLAHFQNHQQLIEYQNNPTYSNYYHIHKYANNTYNNENAQFNGK